MLAVVAVSLLAAPAWSAVPYPPNCTVTWYRGGPYAVDDSTVLICPNGDLSNFNVVVMDQFNQPMIGVTVYALITPDALNRLKISSAQANTGPGGVAIVKIKGGIDVSGLGVDPAALGILAGGVKVQCLGVTLYPLPPEDPPILRWWLSPDSNGNYEVKSDDGARFNNDWQRVMRDCHTNFHRIGPLTQDVTNSADGGIFNAHWQHTLTFPTP
jgi:hypothetical protein